MYGLAMKNRLKIKRLNWFPDWCPFLINWLHNDWNSSYFIDVTGMWSGGREERTVESYTTKNPTIACVTAYKMTGEEKNIFKKKTKPKNKTYTTPCVTMLWHIPTGLLGKAITWLLLSIERHNVSIFKNILHFCSSVQIIHTIIVLSCQIKKIYTVAAGWAFFLQLLKRVHWNLLKRTSEQLKMQAST